jgi:hypothetical protein
MSRLLKISETFPHPTLYRLEETQLRAESFMREFEGDALAGTISTVSARNSKPDES